MNAPKLAIHPGVAIWMIFFDLLFPVQCRDIPGFLVTFLGVVPLAFSTGAGARQSVGTGVMGGMLAATFLAVFFMPFFFKFLIIRRLRTNPEEFIAPDQAQTEAKE